MTWANKAQGHAINLDGVMPKITYHTNNGTFTQFNTTILTTPTPYDNIDVQ